MSADLLLMGIDTGAKMQVAIRRKGVETRYVDWSVFLDFSDFKGKKGFGEIHAYAETNSTLEVSLLLL